MPGKLLYQEVIPLEVVVWLYNNQVQREIETPIQQKQDIKGDQFRYQATDTITHHPIRRYWSIIQHVDAVKIRLLIQTSSN